MWGCDHSEITFEIWHEAPSSFSACGRQLFHPHLLLMVGGQVWNRKRGWAYAARTYVPFFWDTCPRTQLLNFTKSCQALFQFVFEKNTRAKNLVLVSNFNLLNGAVSPLPY